MFGAANTDDDQNVSVDAIIPWQGLESTTKSLSVFFVQNVFSVYIQQNFIMLNIQM